MSLKSLILSDINEIFLKDDDEFGELLSIGTNSTNSVTCIGSLQNNVVDNNSGVGALQKVSSTLYVKYPIGGSLTLNAGQVVYINLKPYKVNDIMEEMGMATVYLTKGVL